MKRILADELDIRLEDDGKKLWISIEFKMEKGYPEGVITI